MQKYFYFRHSILKSGKGHLLGMVSDGREPFLCFLSNDDYNLLIGSAVPMQFCQAEFVPYTYNGQLRVSLADFKPLGTK